MDHLLLMILLFCGLKTGFSTVVVITSANETLPFSDMEAGFAPRIPGAGLLGMLYAAEPRNACETLITGPALDKSPFAAFVVVERGQCTFEVKVRNAQAAGYAAVIVYNNDESLELVTMSGSPTGIEIPAVFISKGAGEVILSSVGDPATRCYILPTMEYTAWSVMAVSFISMLAVTSVLATFFFVRRHRLRNFGATILPTRQPPGLTAAEVKALPTLIYRAVGDENTNSETCVVCLEDYEHGQKLRILPCHHAFHAICIDKWLMTRKPFCPVCKRDAHNNSEIVSERTPLLSAGLPFPIVPSVPAATQTSPMAMGQSNNSSSSSISVPSSYRQSTSYPSLAADDASPHNYRSSSYTSCPSRLATGNSQV